MMDEYEIGLIAHGKAVTTRGTRSHVDFNFSCLFSTYEYHENMLLRVNSRPSIRRSSISIGLDKFMSYEDSIELIDQELRNWPVLDGQESERREVIEMALHAANRILGSMPPKHNVLVIPLCIEIACHCVVDENRAMVLLPSSIESLKIKTDKGCSI
ncbi:hypothetical protein F511_21820 [Dorcoceras hygrometricum]|uniref:Uncharacterized protein n=1 Tax=Dorcoceras hygrometricum TaxID=472368 RepID=A0A2Z7BYZ5_9LAMI|nr:hypothetical protein F511_21820 [Dorcoceras hygrometricum]